MKARVVLPEKVLAEAKTYKPKGLIFSGGPSSVYEKGAPHVDVKVFNLKIPVLGICYGQQLMAYLLGGKVKLGTVKEFGPAYITVDKSKLFENIPAQTFRVWMNHGDKVIELPKGFSYIAKSNNIKSGAMADEKRKLYAVQFHPEVVHTQFGELVLSNFIKICDLIPKKQTITKEYVDSLIKDIHQSVGDKKAICALSGGVDSSVAALLVHRAIGINLTSVYIDSGLMRENETKQLEIVFKRYYKMNVKIVDAKKEFLKNLKGIINPEKKRMIIGKTFINVFEKVAKKVGATFLVQGTIYPDVIESAGTKHSSKIKSHHNVGGLPKHMKLALVEPLRMMYKDQVRLVGSILKLPHSIVTRQPFPGPGLAIRIIGAVTEKKLRLVRKTDTIVRDEIEKAGLTDKLWQVLTVYTGVKSTGVRGDSRAYGETIAIRVIEAKDAMSAQWSRLSYDLLDKMSTRIVNEIKEVNRVVYDITNKPPATMEWE